MKFFNRLKKVILSLSDGYEIVTTPVNKVSRNNKTRSEQNGAKVTTRTTSTEQRSLGKDRVRFSRCTRLSTL